MTKALAGGCACGAVRYRLASAPMFTHCCHCLLCQRQTGGGFVIHAMIEAERVVLQAGETRGDPAPTGSGAANAVHRCVACGTAVWSRYARAPGVCFVKAGTLDDPAALTPGAHIFVRSKLPWLPLPEATPAFETYYDAATLWPPESLARRAAVTAG